MEHTCTIEIPSKELIKCKGMEALSQFFGTNVTVTVNFTISNWEREAAEPAVGFFNDFFYATDVDLTEVYVSHPDGGVEDVYLVERLQTGITDLLKECCIEECNNHPEWVQKIVEQQEERDHETRMEYRRESEREEGYGNGAY